MGQRELSKYAAMRDAPTTKPRKEVSVVGMGQSELPKVAAMKDAPTVPGKEGSVLDMGQTGQGKLPK